MNKIYKTYILLRNNLKQVPKDRFGAILDSHSFFDAIVDNHNVLFIEADCYDSLELPLTASFEPYPGSDFIFNVDVDNSAIIEPEIIPYDADKMTTKVYIDNFIDVNANIFNSFESDNFSFLVDNNLKFENTYYVESHSAKKFNTKIDNIILEDEFSAILVSGWYDHFSFNLAHWIVLDEFEARLIPASTYTFEFFFDERLKQEATFKVDVYTEEDLSYNISLDFPVYYFNIQVASYNADLFNSLIDTTDNEIYFDSEVIRSLSEAFEYDFDIDFNINMLADVELKNLIPLDIGSTDIIIPYFSDNYFITIVSRDTTYLSVIFNDDSQLSSYIDLTKVPTQLKVNFDDTEFTKFTALLKAINPSKFNAEANSNSLINAYFIYCTNAKLSDYNEPTNTLGSMSVSTLEELALYKHVYN